MWEKSKQNKVLGEVQIMVLVLSHQPSKVQRYSIYYHVRHRKAANLIFYWTTHRLMERLRIQILYPHETNVICEIGLYKSKWLDLTNHFSSTYVRRHRSVIYIWGICKDSALHISRHLCKKRNVLLKTNADVLSGCSWEWLTLGASGGGVWLLLSRLSFSVLFPFSVWLAGMVWRVGSDPDSCIWTSLTWDRKWV